MHRLVQHHIISGLYQYVRLILYTLVLAQVVGQQIFPHLLWVHCLFFFIKDGPVEFMNTLDLKAN